MEFKRNNILTSMPISILLNSIHMNESDENLKCAYKTTNDTHI